MKRTHLALSFLVLAACGGPPARLAPVVERTIAMNSEVHGTLSRSDAQLRDSSRYQAWRFEGVAGQIVQIDVVSTDFDAYAILHDGAGTKLADNDDGGGGTNARITFTLPTSGSYRILANSLAKGRYGRYTVHLRSLGVATANATGGGLLPGTVGQIMRGQTMSGQLSPNDPRLSDSSVFQAWTFVGTAGETIVVEVVSSEFDAYALIQDSNGSKLAADDDSGGGTNARITFTLPYSGAYRLIANTYRQGSYGAFSLTVR
jgi:competence protein ComGC